MSIEVEHLSVTINQLEILKEIDLSIPKNTFTSIIAPSGAGKSTLLKVLTGILEPSSGKILIDGQETSKLNTLFSYMPQENTLLPWLSVYQNVTLYQKINHKTIDKKQVFSTFWVKRLSAFFATATFRWDAATDSTTANNAKSGTLPFIG